MSYRTAAVFVLLAVAVVVGATHELAGVLAFDWSTAGADLAPAPVTVALP